MHLLHRAVQEKGVQSIFAASLRLFTAEVDQSQTAAIAGCFCMSHSGQPNQIFFRKTSATNLKSLAFPSRGLLPNTVDLPATNRRGENTPIKTSSSTCLKHSSSLKQRLTNAGAQSTSKALFPHSLFESSVSDRYPAQERVATARIASEVREPSKVCRALT